MAHDSGRVVGRSRLDFGLREPWVDRIPLPVVLVLSATLLLILGYAVWPRPGPNAAEPPLVTTAAPRPPTRDATDSVPSASSTQRPSGASPTPSSPPARSTGPTKGPAPVPPPPPRPTPFGPVTFEAEAYANTIGGSAWVQRYPGASGGVIVRNIGDWGDPSGDGWLRFNDVTVPAAGTYALTLFYVHLDDEPTRTVTITVPGATSIVIQVSGSATCCAATTVRVTLKAGANTVTFTNPNGHAPSIDRIVISGT